MATTTAQLDLFHPAHRRTKTKHRARYNAGSRAITAGKFIMLCIDCILISSLDPLRPYKNAFIVTKNKKQDQDVHRYPKRLGITLGDPE